MVLDNNGSLEDLDQVVADFWNEHVEPALQAHGSHAG